MHSQISERFTFLSGIGLRTLSQSRPLLKSEFHAVRKGVAQNQGVLSIVEAERLDIDKDIVENFVVVGAGNGNSLPLRRVRDGVVPDNVVAGTTIPRRGRLPNVVENQRKFKFRGF